MTPISPGQSASLEQYFIDDYDRVYGLATGSYEVNHFAVRQRHEETKSLMNRAIALIMTGMNPADGEELRVALIQLPMGKGVNVVEPVLLIGVRLRQSPIMTPTGTSEPIMERPRAYSDVEAEIAQCARDAPALHR